MSCPRRPPWHPPQAGAAGRGHQPDPSRRGGDCPWQSLAFQPQLSSTAAEGRLGGHSCITAGSMGPRISETSLRPETPSEATPAPLSAPLPAPGLQIGGAEAQLGFEKGDRGPCPQPGLQPALARERPRRGLRLSSARAGATAPQLPPRPGSLAFVLSERSRVDSRAPSSFRASPLTPGISLPSSSLPFS